MKHAHSLVFSPLRLITIVVGMACMPVHADEYSDVSQLVRERKLAEALSRADQFLASQPKDPQMRFIKGVIQRDSGKTSEAIATFNRLAEEFPNLPEPHNNLAVMYAAQSQFEKARDELEKAISTNPSYATAHENLGDIYTKLASQAYNKALQLDTSNQAVPVKLALIQDIFSTNVNATTATAKAPARQPATAAVQPPSAPIPPLVATGPANKPTGTATASAVVATGPKVTTPPAAPVVSAAAVAQNTPPVAPPKPAAPVAADGDGAAKDVEAAVAKWASVWSARDVKAYLASYGKEFDPPGSMSRKAWEEERAQRINGKASISVKIDKLSVSVNGNHALAKFRQDYKAGGLAVASHKTLEFSKLGDRWQIIKETVGN